MKLFIAQAPHHDNLGMLEENIKKYFDVTYFIFPEGYLSSQIHLSKAKVLAKKYRVSIITSLRDEGKDIAVIIDSKGELIYKRVKTNPQEDVILNQPLVFKDKRNEKTIGFLLCMELLKGLRDLPNVTYDFIVQPIGVGMFSEEQFSLWLNEAKKIAIKFKTFVVGVSHSDGSYKNCGVSIPIAYCVNPKGEIVHLLKNDVKNTILNLSNESFRIIEFS